jgi:hypothetical protein
MTVAGENPAMYATMTEGMPNVLTAAIFCVCLPLFTYLRGADLNWVPYVIVTVTNAMICGLFSALNRAMVDENPGLDADGLVTKAKDSDEGDQSADSAATPQLIAVSRLLRSLPFVALVALAYGIHGITDVGFLRYATYSLHWEPTTAAMLVSAHMMVVSIGSVVLIHANAYAGKVIKTSLVGYATIAMAGVAFYFMSMATDDIKIKGYIVVAHFALTVYPMALLYCTTWSGAVLAYKTARVVTKLPCTQEELTAFEGLLQFSSLIGFSLGIAVCYISTSAYVFAIFYQSLATIAFTAAGTWLLQSSCDLDDDEVDDEKHALAGDGEDAKTKGGYGTSKSI